MKIGLIFDMDGVIVDNHEFHYKTWQALCKDFGKPMDAEQYKENLNGRTLDQIVQFIFDEPISESRVRELGERKEALYRKIYQPFIRPLPGLHRFLDKAHAKGVPMVVGTSAPKENVYFTMNGTGLGHYFKAVLDERAVLNGKPDPEIYLKCAEKIGLPNAHCVVFEDAPSGIKAGKAAGSKVIGLATSYSRSELDADFIIDDFSDLSLEQIIDLLGIK